MILIWLAFYLAHSFCLITLVSPATRQRYAKTPKGWQHWLSLTLFYSIPASFLWADDPQPLTVLASFLLFTAGSTLAIWAVRSNPWFSPAIEMPPTVVTDGAYALISHPGYCGFAMMAGASERARLLMGYGSVGNDNPIASGVPYFKEPKVKHSYDPEKVKFHLKKAGLTSLKVDISTSDAAYAGAVDAATLMKESAAKCGIDINVIQEAGDAYWDAVWMKKPWCMSYWSGRPTPDLMFSTAYAADAAWNDSFWKNDQFNKLLVAGRSELDQAKRGEIYGEMQDIVAEDGGVAVLMFYNYMNACAKTVAHPDVIAPNWDVDGMKITQRWWFA